jgi:hypothetical protein
MWYLYTMEFYAAMKKNEMLSFTGKWMDLQNIILSALAWPKRPKIVCSPSYADTRSTTNTTMGLDFDHMIKVSAHKGGMRIGKTPKKLDSICSPQHRDTKAYTLKQLRPLGEGDQELEKRLDQEELT